MTNAVGSAGANSASSSNNNQDNNASPPPPPPTQTASSIHTTATTTNNAANSNIPTATPSTTNPVASTSTSNRLQFNRMAAERKTVHVMSDGLNKDLTKRNRPMLTTNAAGNVTSHTVGGAMGGAGASGNNQQQYFNQSGYGGGGGQSTLDYNMTTGRSSTNASSFLQKLSSKFSRR